MKIINWMKDKLGINEETASEEPTPMEETAGCSRCGFEFPLSVMMFGDDGKFCSECLPEHKKEKEEIEFSEKQKALLSKVKYFCPDCRFHFTRKKDFQIGGCPNCGSDKFCPESKLI